MLETFKKIGDVLHQVFLRLQRNLAEILQQRKLERLAYKQSYREARLKEITVKAKRDAKSSIHKKKISPQRSKRAPLFALNPISTSPMKPPTNVLLDSSLPTVSLESDTHKLPEVKLW